MNERESNRREFPTAAAFVDRMRETFGPDVRLRWWCEDGRSIGDVPAAMVEQFGKQQLDSKVADSCPTELLETKSLRASDG